MGKPEVPQVLQDQGSLVDDRTSAAEPRGIARDNPRGRPGARQTQPRESARVPTPEKGA